MEIRQAIPKDAIPSIDEPSFTGEYTGSEDDRVVVPDIDAAERRAYPLRVLNFHEIANDVIGEVPIAVTWCPLCGTIVVFDRRVDGRTLSFGVSGKLADDNLVMYDRETGSEWKQSLGTCIDGPLDGERLRILPTFVSTWEQYRALVDTPTVLSETSMESEAASDSNDPARIDYDRDPYRRYLESDGFGLDAHRNNPEPRTWDRVDFGPKTPVIGLGRGENVLGIARPTLDANDGLLRASVGNRRAIVVGTATEMYAYEDPGLPIEGRRGEWVIGDGTEWHAISGESRDGRSLTRIPARREFAFTWQDDHGPRSFLQGP